MKSRPKVQGNRQRLLERLHASVDHGDLPRAHRLLSRLEDDGVDENSWLARWRVLTLQDNLAPALKAAQDAVEAYPGCGDLQHALGWTLFELERVTEATAYLEEACYLEPDFADGWHDLAVAHEALGNLSGMKAAFTQVFRLDQVELAMPSRFAPEEILAWADRSVRSLPGSVVAAVTELPIFVQDYPDDWILDEPPYDPRLLGLFDGPTYADLRGSEGGGVSPHVYLYQRNLERRCPDSRTMAEQVRITLHHEIGHFLGLDEEELHHRGLG